MAMAWRAADIPAAMAKEAIDASIREADLPDWARVDWSGDNLNVRIDKGGKSTFLLALKADGSGSRIVEVSRKVAFLHRAFVGSVERFVDQAMLAAGYTRV